MLQAADSPLRPIAAAILIAAIGTGVLAPTAEAAGIQVERRVVNYADLDLTQPAGVQSLKWRVNAALRAVCKVGHRWSMEEAVAQRTCLARARPDAQAQADRAIATAAAAKADSVLAASGL